MHMQLFDISAGLSNINFMKYLDVSIVNFSNISFGSNDTCMYIWVKTLQCNNIDYNTHNCRIEVRYPCHPLCIGARWNAAASFAMLRLICTQARRQHALPAWIPVYDVFINWIFNIFDTVFQLRKRHETFCQT